MLELRVYLGVLEPSGAKIELTNYTMSRSGLAIFGSRNSRHDLKDQSVSLRSDCQIENQIIDSLQIPTSFSSLQFNPYIHPNL